MQISYRHFPHPVLAPFSDDFVNCAFQTTVKIQPSGNSYSIHVRCKTSCDELSGNIRKGLANYAIHVECSRTRYRELFQSEVPDFLFTINSDLLDGKVQICSFILAKNDIQAYYSNSFHADYGKIRFTVNRGDILAVAEDKTFDAEKNVDPLRRIPSIFIVVTNTAEDAPSIDIDLVTSDKIIIKLSPINYNMYKALRLNKRLYPILSSLIIIPTLVMILESIKEGNLEYYDELSDKRWFSVLDKRLRTFGVDIKSMTTVTDSSIVLTQKLIGEPIERSLKGLIELCDED